MPEPRSDRNDAERPRTPAEALVAALFDAGPEAAEHLLRAAHELLLAAKAVVDAGERALEAQRDPSRSEQAAPADRPRVRRVDLA
jgi:hypothetical protein